MSLRVVDVAGVPPAGVTAVALNVTAVNATETTNLRVFPSGMPLPETSNLNPVRGRAVPNMVVAGVGADGRVAVYNDFGTTDCIVDVMGYFCPQPASRLQPLVPDRLLDTRTGVGAPLQRLRGGSTIDLQVAGRGGVPAAGATAVVLNVTAVNPSAAGFVTVWPSGEPRPNVSNLNYDTRRDVPNLVVCKLGGGGRVSIFADAGDLDVIADVVGCFTSDGTALVPLTPGRVLDTRLGIGAPQGRVPGGGEIELTVAGVRGVAAAAQAVVLNVTGTDVLGNTFVTVYPNGVARPNTSTLNVPAGDTMANLAIARVGTGGKVRLFNSTGALHLIADVAGYFI
jgi:hypothetical protein